MKKIDVLRQIIREEMISVLKEELPKLINENLHISKNKKPTRVLETLNTVETYKKAFENKFTNSSPLNSLLNETANSMMSDEVENLSFTTDNINPTAFFQPKEAVASDVSGMLSTARPSSTLETVVINEVPDYSHLMKKILNT